MYCCTESRGAGACVITFTAKLGVRRADFDESIQKDYISS